MRSTEAGPRPPVEILTDRLRICAPDPGRGRAVAEAIAESIEELRPWMPWAQRIPTAEEAIEVAREARSAFDEGSDFPLHLIDRDTGEYIGGSGLHRFDWSVPRFEIGYWIRSRRVGQGYCSEAVRAVARMALDDLGAARVEIHTSARNERSRRVAEACGFELEGVLRSHARETDGSLRDTLIFARVATR